MKSVLIFTLSLVIFSPLTVANSHPNAKEICGAKTCEDVRLSLKKSAYRGSIFAQKLVALMYLDGLGSDVKPSLAKKFLTMAAKQEDPESALMLAFLYKGRLEEDAEKHEYWLRKAEKYSDLKIDELRKMYNVLEVNYNPDNNLTLLAEKISKSKSQNAYGGGSHILGSNCNNSARSSCISRKLRKSNMTTY